MIFSFFLDKENLEKDLATKITGIHHHEEVIRSLEREKRRLTEKMGNLEFSLSAVTKEKEMLTVRYSDNYLYRLLCLL